MNLREEEISRILGQLSKQTDGFENPKIVMIGGYALRAFTSLSRYTRDCDFVLKKSEGWNLDKIQKKLPKDLNIEFFEKRLESDLKKSYKEMKEREEGVKP
jgi:hypothetical protein